MNAAVAAITTGSVTNLTATSASVASMNAGVALLTTATVTTLNASGASIASANIGNLQFTAASIASINAGVAVINNLTATSASIASANVGVALITTGTVTALTATGASVASANVGTAVITGLTVTGASIASVNAGTATLSGNLTLNGGTANGVLFLDGSKVATSGSALTFDGTNLAVGASPGFYGAQVATAGSISITGGNLLKLWNTGGTGVGGISSPGTDTIAFGLGASFTEGMRLTSTGLGIGTSSPTTKLDVNVGGTNNIKFGTASNFGIISLNGSVTTSASMGIFGGATGDADLYYQNATGGGHRFRVGTTTMAYLDSSGNLGLGVTPSAWGSAVKAYQVGNSSLVGTSTQMLLSQNYFFDGADKYIATGPASQYYQVSGSHQWRIAASGTAGNTISFTQAMTLDASGNLLVGTTTSTLGRLEVVGGAGIRVNEDAAGTKVISIRSAFAGGDPAINVSTNHPLTFLTNNTERARITSGGDLLVGTTTAGAGAGFDTRLAVEASSRDPAIFKFTGAAGSGYPVIAWHSAATGDNFLVRFATEASITTRGSITYNRAGGLVAYNTTSDYRAKDILGPVQNSGATIDALKVYEGQMKGATQSRPMLVAHEAQEHAPYAVTGEKDAVNEDGTPKYQQMDVSALVPLLLAEIQSLRARVAQLETK
jgi:hypothetical protein